MPKKKTPSILHIASPDKANPMPTILTCNRAARKAYPTNPTMRLHPLRKDAKGDYHREDPNEVKKHNEGIRAAQRRRSESLRRESEAAKKMSRLQAANSRNAANPGGVQAPLGERDVEKGTGSGTDCFACADQDG